MARPKMASRRGGRSKRKRNAAVHVPLSDPKVEEYDPAAPELFPLQPGELSTFNPYLIDVCVGECSKEEHGHIARPSSHIGAGKAEEVAGDEADEEGVEKAAEKVIDLVSDESEDVSEHEAGKVVAEEPLPDNCGEGSSKDPCPFVFTSTCVGVKEPLSSLSILQEKIKLLEKDYAAIRQTRGDGNCFYQGFIYSLLEHILETQDKAEIHHLRANVRQCRKELRDLGDPDLVIDHCFSAFSEQLDSVVEGSLSHAQFLHMCLNEDNSYNIVMFLRTVTSSEIRRREKFFAPFIAALAADTSVTQFCKDSVDPMGSYADHVQIQALSDALGVPIRLVNLDLISTVLGEQHLTDINCEMNRPPAVTLLYWPGPPGHYDILYPKLLQSFAGCC